MTYEVRAMSFGEILDASFHILRDHFVVIVGIAAVMHVPAALATHALTDYIEQAVGSGMPVSQAAAWGGGFALLSMAVQPIVAAGITHAIGEVYLGRATSIGRSLGVGLSMLVRLVGTAILMTLLVILGFVLLVIPGIVMLLYFLLVWQVAVFERRFGLRALGRSRTLMAGAMLRGLGLVVVSWLLVAVLSSGLELVVGWVGVIGPVISALAQSVGYAYGSVVLTLFYFDLRCRKEQFDLEHLAQVVAARGPGGAAPVGEPG